MPLSIDAAAPQPCASAKSFAPASRSTPCLPASSPPAPSAPPENDIRRPRVLTDHEPPRRWVHALASVVTVGSGPLKPPIGPGYVAARSATSGVIAASGNAVTPTLKGGVRYAQPTSRPASSSVAQ